MKKNLIEYIYCLKQQSYLFLLYLIALATSYHISLYFGFREPYHVSLETFIKFSAGFIFVGALARLLIKKNCT